MLKTQTNYGEVQNEFRILSDCMIRGDATWMKTDGLPGWKQTNQPTHPSLTAVPASVEQIQGWTLSLL